MACRDDVSRTLLSAYAKKKLAGVITYNDSGITYIINTFILHSTRSQKAMYLNYAW